MKKYFVAGLILATISLYGFPEEYEENQNEEVEKEIKKIDRAVYLSNYLTDISFEECLELAEDDLFYRMVVEMNKLMEQ